MAATWPISWQNKNKRKADSEVEQTRNKAKCEQTAKSSHSNTVGNPACDGWHLKMVK